MIPQLLHWVWPRSGAITPDEENALRSWHSNHPAWRHLFWTSQPENAPALLYDLDFEVRALPLLFNHQLYSLLGCHCEHEEEENFLHEARAVVASIEIMACYGGVCPPQSDYCAGNIEPMLEGVRLFTRDNALLNADLKCSSTGASLPLYGASSNHPALWNMVRDLKNSVVAPRDCSCVISAGSLVELLQFRLGRHPDLVTFPAAVFEMKLRSML